MQITRDKYLDIKSYKRKPTEGTENAAKNAAKVQKMRKR